MKEEAKKEIGRYDQGKYFCPECGKPFDDISTTESHLPNAYELHLKAWHFHGKDLATKIT